MRDAKDWIREALVQGLELQRADSDRPTSGYLVRNEETGVVVREAVPEDAPALAAVGARSFQHAHASVLRPADLIGDLTARFDEDELRRELVESECRWLIALWNGEPVGFAQLDGGAAPFGPPGARPIQIGGLYVAPDWEGHGVGSALIEACSKLAAECAYETLRVRVWEGNRDAVAFLRSWGFVRTGYELMTLGKSTAPMLVMSRSLANLD